MDLYKVQKNGKKRCMQEDYPSMEIEDKNTIIHVQQIHIN